jgi:hypothetical protein
MNTIIGISPIIGTAHESDDNEIASDAALVAIGEAFDLAAARANDPATPEDETIAANAASDNELHRAALIPATSPAGLRVKARMARYELESGVGISRDDAAGALLSSLLADLGVPPTQPPCSAMQPPVAPERS